MDPETVAALDQGDAEFSAELRHLVRAVRAGVAESGAQQTVCNFTAYFNRKLDHLVVSALLAQALRQLAEGVES